MKNRMRKTHKEEGTEGREKKHLLSLTVKKGVLLASFVLLIGALFSAILPDAQEVFEDEEQSLGAVASPYGNVNLIGTMLNKQTGNGNITMQPGYIYKIELSGSGGSNERGALITAWLDLRTGSTTTYSYSQVKGGSGGSGTHPGGNGGDATFLRASDNTIMMVAGGGGGRSINVDGVYITGGHAGYTNGISHANGILYRGSNGQSFGGENSGAGGSGGDSSHHPFNGGYGQYGGGGGGAGYGNGGGGNGEYYAGGGGGGGSSYVHNSLNIMGAHSLSAGNAYAYITVTQYASEKATITASNKTVTYDGKPQAITPTIVPSIIESNMVVTYQGTGGTSYGPSTTAPAKAGTYSVTVTLKDAVGYTADPVTRTLTINKATPTFKQSESYIYVYGEELSAIKLSEESASVPGTFSFKDPSMKPTVNTTKVKIVFTPSDAVNYNTVEFDLTISVAKASPKFTQSASYIYTYGETLNALSLAGESASTPGTFAFKSPSNVPNIDTTSVTIVFTPTDSTNYRTVEFDLTISVVEAIITFSQSKTYGYVYGETLNALSLKDESASVPGTFAFKDPSFVPAAGTETVRVVFVPEDTYNHKTVEFDLTISVSKAEPTFTQTGSYTYSYGDSLNVLSLNETASVPGTFIFMDPSHMPALGTSTVVIVFTPVDDDNYCEMEFEITIVTKIKASFTQTGTYDYVYGDSLDVLSLKDESASAPGTFSFKDPSDVPTAGIKTVKVVFVPEDAENYNTVEFDLTISVSKAIPTFTQTDSYTYVYGDFLNIRSLAEESASVPGTFAFKYPFDMPPAGTQTVRIVFTPEDADNYSTTEFDLTIEVKAIPTFTQSGPYTYVYGDSLDIRSLAGESASVPGTFAFKYPSDVPPAGTKTVRIVFVPEDTDYNPIEFDLTISVSKAEPTFTQTGPYAYAYGETLNALSLAGESASVSGTFAFKDPSDIPPVGTSTVRIVFTPEDTDNYSTMEFELTITVTLYFSVTFVTNGGSSADPLKVAADGLASVPADPARKNWIFGGWFSDAALTISWDFSADVVTEDIVLYAKWDRDPDITYHTVTFVTNGGTSVGTQTVAHGDTIIPITTSGTDRTFAGWYLSPDLTGPEWDITHGEVTSDMTLYAKWEQSTDAAESGGDDDKLGGIISLFPLILFIIGVGLSVFVLWKILKGALANSGTKNA